MGVEADIGGWGNKKFGEEPGGDVDNILSSQLP